jgi:hypothetical protein
MANANSNIGQDSSRATRVPTSYSERSVAPPHPTPQTRVGTLRHAERAGGAGGQSAKRDAPRYD